VLITRAVELAPYDGYILDSLGWLYYQRGEYEQAHETLHRAGQLAEDAIIFEHIADAALKLGKHEEAEHFLKRALELEGTKPEDRERISEKYQELVER
jgi:Tfp pilus assembly protein PilF